MIVDGEGTAGSLGAFLFESEFGTIEILHDQAHAEVHIDVINALVGDDEALETGLVGNRAALGDADDLGGGDHGDGGALQQGEQAIALREQGAHGGLGGVEELLLFGDFLLQRGQFHERHFAGGEVLFELGDG